MNYKVSFLLCFHICIQALPANMIDHWGTNHYHLYLWGTYSHLEKKNNVAEQCYKEIINSNGSTYAYAGYINYLFNTQQYQTIIGLMPKLEATFADHLPTQLIFAKTLEAIGKPQEARKKIVEMSKKAIGKNAEIIYHAATTHIQNNRPADCIALINDHLNAIVQKPMNFIFYFLKAHAYLSLFKKEEALESIKKCLEMNPSFEQGWLFSGLINELQGNVEQALKGYGTFLKLAGPDESVEHQMMNLLLKQQGTLAIAPFEQAIIHYQNKEYKKSLALLNQHLTEQPQHPEAQLLKIELLCAVQERKKAIELLKNLIMQNPTTMLWYRALHLLFLAGIEQEMLESILTESAKKDPNNNMPNLYLADLAIKKNNPNQALRYLKKSFVLATEPNLKEKILYQIALIYFEQAQPAELRKTIEQAEALQPSFAPLLNLIAYYYAKHGENLDRAQNYVKTALSHYQDNIHFLDTQALIWMKASNYQSAAELLQRLIKEAPKDFYILKHYAKLVYTQGNKQEAIDILQQALVYAPLERQQQKIKQLLQEWQSNK